MEMMKGCLSCTRNFHICCFHEYSKVQWGIYHYSHFTVEETENKKGHMTKKKETEKKQQCSLEMKTKLEEWKNTTHNALKKYMLKRIKTLNQKEMKILKVFLRNWQLLKIDKEDPTYQW